MRWLALVLALAMVSLGGPTQAAESIHTHLDWTEGTFEAGMAGAGKHVFPGSVDAPDHERIPFPVNPCHRELSLGLKYEPRNASVGGYHDGTGAELIIPYRFQAGLVHPNGTVLHRITVEEPDLSVFFGVAPDPGTYELELELLEGALVDWQVRVRGWATDDPSCDLWLNEVETNAGQAGDWVELYNEGEGAVDVSGWEIQANRTGTEHGLGDALVLDAGEHRRVDLGPGAFAPVDETVTLAGPHGSPLDGSPSLVDQEGDDRTWQRETDGREPWVFAPGSPGASNG